MVTVLVAALSGAAAALFTFLGVRYVRGGRIRRTEAEKLWDVAEKMREEETAMRHELRDQLAAALRDVEVLRSQVVELHDVVSRTRAEADRYREEAEAAREELDAVRTRIAAIDQHAQKIDRDLNDKEAGTDA